MKFNPSINLILNDEIELNKNTLIEKKKPNEGNKSLFQWIMISEERYNKTPSSFSFCFFVNVNCNKISIIKLFLFFKSKSGVYFCGSTFFSNCFFVWKYIKFVVF